MNLFVQQIRNGDSLAWAAAHLQETLAELVCPACGCEQPGHHYSSCTLIPALLSITIWKKGGGNREARYIDENDCFRVVRVGTVEERLLLEQLIKKYEIG